MRRSWLLWLLLLLLGIGLMTPVATRAATPLVPLLLIHGQGGSADLTWKTAVPYLEGRGYLTGVTLFRVELPQEHADQRLGVLEDAGYVVQEIHRLQIATGAGQVDLVGHSRGGLIVRLVAGGGTADLVRRAVTIGTPHEGVLSADELQAMLRATGLDPKRLPAVDIPPDLAGGSMVLQTIAARERRFSHWQPTALAIGATWRDGLPAVLTGHDGVVSVRSQLAWPGARTMLFRLGPTPAELQAILRSELAPGLLAWKSPHMQSLESEVTLEAVTGFLLAPRVPEQARSCSPGCDGSGAQAPRMAGLDPDRVLTRAEWVYELDRALGLEERLAAPPSKDLEGHWAAGWVRAAMAAGRLKPERTFRPDEPVTRGEALVMLGTGPGPGADRLLTAAEAAALLADHIRR